MSSSEYSLSPSPPSEDLSGITPYVTSSNYVWVGPDYVIKQAREGAPFGAANLAREISVVDAISLQVDESLEIELPRLVEANVDGKWAKLSRVGGQVLTANLVEEYFGDDEYSSFGKKIGQFMAWFGQVRGVEVAAPNADYRSLSRTGEVVRYLPMTILELGEENWPEISECCRRIAREYENLSPKGWLAATGIGHRDLRIPNVSFTLQPDNTHDLRGIFDFGEVGASSTSYELQYLARFPRVAESALDTYESETRRTVSPEAVQFWFRLQSIKTALGALITGKELATYMSLDLRRAFPDLDWPV